MDRTLGNSSLSCCENGGRRARCNEFYKRHLFYNPPSGLMSSDAPISTPLSPQYNQAHIGPTEFRNFETVHGNNIDPAIQTQHGWAAQVPGFPLNPAFDTHSELAAVTSLPTPPAFNNFSTMSFPPAMAGQPNLTVVNPLPARVAFANANTMGVSPTMVPPRDFPLINLHHTPSTFHNVDTMSFSPAMALQCDMSVAAPRPPATTTALNDVDAMRMILQGDSPAVTSLPTTATFSDVDAMGPYASPMTAEDNTQDKPSREPSQPWTQEQDKFLRESRENGHGLRQIAHEMSQKFPEMGEITTNRLVKRCQKLNNQEQSSDPFFQAVKRTFNRFMKELETEVRDLEFSDGSKADGDMRRNIMANLPKKVLASVQSDVARHRKSQYKASMPR